MASAFIVALAKDVIRCLLASAPSRKDAGKTDLKADESDCLTD